jgi:Major Facilitator Superfamily
MLLTWLPNYLNDQIGFDVENSGVFAVLPYLACFLFTNISGQLADNAIKRGYSVSYVRKFSQVLAELVPATTLVLAGYVKNVSAVVFFLTLSVGFGGFQGGGFAVNHLDIGPNVAGILMGLGNTLATVSFFFSIYLCVYIDLLLLFRTAFYFIGKWNCCSNSCWIACCCTT